MPRKTRTDQDLIDLDLAELTELDAGPDPWDDDDDDIYDNVDTYSDGLLWTSEG